MRRKAVERAAGAPSLVLGQHAWQGLTGKAEGFGAARGFVDFTAKRVATFRPELAYFWAAHEWAAFDIDVARFARMIRGELEPLPRLVTEVDVATMAHVAKRAAELGHVAYDIETLPSSREEPWTGKDPTRAVLRTMGFGWRDVAYSFFWETAHPTVKSLTKRVLADDKIQKRGINVIWFDNRVLARYGMPVHNFLDIRDVRRALSSTSRLSLAYLATLYTDYPAWKAAKDEDSEDVTK
jgi:hypothetical protein